MTSSVRLLWRCLALLLLPVWMLSGCAPSASQDASLPAYESQAVSKASAVYVLAVHPLHNPKRLYEVYQPLIERLNARLPGITLKLEASSSYADYEAKMARREVAFTLPNPYQTLMALRHGYQVFAKMGDDEQFRGVILVRKDSGIRDPRQLIGKAVSYPAATALAAGMMPQWFFQQHGVNVARDLDNRYVGTQESSMMNVVLGKVSAGCTWPLPWAIFQKEQPDLAAQLEVRWETPHLVNNALLARDDVPPEVVRRVKQEMVTLHESAEGKAILARMALSRFEPADDSTYRPVAEFLRRFDAEVRPVLPPGQ